MIQMKLVSNLRNKFSDIERIVKTGEPVYLTKDHHAESRTEGDESR